MGGAMGNQPDRSVALDAYRGFVMLAMVSGGLGTAKLLGDPNWGWFAHQMRHLDWEGCTFWDLIQPSFMFIVGAAMPYAFAKRQDRGESWSSQFHHALRRACLLAAIGIFLDCYAEGKIQIQFIRVLQQIAIGYVLAFFVLHLAPAWQALTAALILVGHTLLFVLYGGSGAGGPWEPSHNVGTWLDTFLHLPLSKGHYVTLNALSSTATILFGVLAGRLLRANVSSGLKLGVLVFVGIGGLLLGLGLSEWVPLVKRIWTASFAVYAAGWTCLMLAAFYAVCDLLKWRAWAFPLVVVGMNSIAIYVSAGIFNGNIQRALKPFLDPALVYVPEAWGPVVIAVGVVAGQWLFCYWLYRHRIFFKV